MHSTFTIYPYIYRGGATSNCSSSIRCSSLYRFIFNFLRLLCLSYYILQWL